MTTPLQQVLDDGEGAIIARWTTMWPEASAAAARDMFDRIRVALRTGQPASRAPSGLSIAALRALRTAIFEELGDAAVSAREVNTLDLVFAADVAVLEEELARIQRQLRSLVEQVPLAVAIVEAPSGRTVIANARNQAIFRQSAPESRQGVAHYGSFRGYGADGHVLAGEEWPLARAIRDGVVVEGEVIRITRGDGSGGHIRVSAAPIKDDAGVVTGGVVIYDDVSVERQMADGLRFLADAGAVLGSSLDYHETLTALARLAVPRLADWCSVEIIGDDGLAHQLAVTHIDPQKVELALQLRKKFPPDPQLTQTGLYKVLTTGESELYEEIPAALIDQIPSEEQRTLTRDLGLRSALVVPIRANGRVLGALSLVTAESGRRYSVSDVLLTQEVADRAGLAIEHALLYQKAQDAIRAREDFLSIASHELRTPLTALHLQISTLVAKAQQGTPATLTKEKLHRLDSQMVRLRELVDQLLDVSRLATGRVAYNIEDADLSDLAGAVVDEVKDVAAASGTPLAITTRGDTRGRWDRGRIEQVVTNLIGNAVKYGAGKPVDVEVVGDGDAVSVVVSDRGVGIDAADLGRIFERFERAASARNFNGLGLGLWISNQIVRGHGGTIGVESTLGVGSRFTLTVPRRSEQTEQ